MDCLTEGVVVAVDNEGDEDGDEDSDGNGDDEAERT